MTVTANGDTVNYDKAGAQRTADMVKIAPCGLVATATFTPAASSHTAGDSVGGAKALDFGAISGSTIRIVSATLEIDTATIETTAWTLHLYSVTPPSATADDGAWDLPSGDRASYLGSIAFVQVVDLGSTLWIETTNIQKQLVLAGTGLFGYLVNGTTLSTAAVAHIVKLQAVYA
jgi:hypothetical protein